MHSIPIDQRVQQFVNIETMPYPRKGVSGTKYFASTSGSGTVTDITAADGTPGVRCTCVDGTAAWALYTARGSTAPILNPVLGETYTILLSLRASSASTIAIIIGAGGASTNALALNSSAAVDSSITNFRFTFTVNATMVTNGSAYLKLTKSAAGWTTDDWFEVSKVMLVKGAYKGDFGAGDVAGWQWTGAANASTSIGYPKSLAS